MDFSKTEAVEARSPAKLVAIFDLDNTLSDKEHRQHYLDGADGRAPDWDAFYGACGADPERPAMVAHALALARLGVEIAVFTGRTESCREVSMSWLAERGIEPMLARFRQDGDCQKSSAMKLGWLAELKASPGVAIICAVDDEAANLEAFAQAGLLCVDATDEAGARALFKKIQEGVLAGRAQAFQRGPKS